MKKLLGILVLGLILNNCSIGDPKEIQAHYDSQTPMQVCMHYLTTDWMNVYRPYSERSIMKRNIDCRPFIEIAARKYKMDREAWDRMYEAVETLK